MISHDYIRGALAMGFLVAAVFFLRFWRETRDRLFAFFALAFLILGLNRPLADSDPDHNASLPYLIRLAAYVIIIIAIADKNFRRT
jgi:hypothetical protein